MRAEIKQDSSVELTIVREFSWPPEQVFEAWLKPEQLIQWMGPSDGLAVSDVEVNAVEGGQYTMKFNEPDCSSHRLKGIYKIIERYNKLVFTWAWEASGDEKPEETLVSLDFERIAKGTRMTLLHQRFSNVEARDKHHSGWTGTLDKFERRAKSLFSK